MNIGGGFGGKETRFSPLTTVIAVAANKYRLHQYIFTCPPFYRVGRPVRIMLDRNEDMVYSGQRHPFLGNYKVGFTSEGKLTALEMSLYSNGGHSCDLSVAVSNKSCMQYTVYFFN